MLKKALGKQGGAATSEFLVYFTSAAHVGIRWSSVGLMSHAKNTVSYATFEAARKVQSPMPKLDPIQEEFGLRIAPLFGGDGTPEKAMAAIAQGTLEAETQDIPK